MAVVTGRNRSSAPMRTSPPASPKMPDRNEVAKTAMARAAAAPSVMESFQVGRTV
jgi:hypothetical protein